MSRSANLFVRQSANLSAEIRVLYSNNESVSLDGYTIDAVAKRSIYSNSSNDIVLSLDESLTDLANGVFTVEIGGNETANMKADSCYMLSVFAVAPDGYSIDIVSGKVFVTA